ncbi:MAG: N-acetylmuramoyl-L-alanine amidase [Chitinophagaceae bacterium]
MMTKRFFTGIFFGVSVILLLSFGVKRTTPIVPPQKPALATIIIDAGHGGADPGANGQFSTEADVALSIAMKLGKAIEKEFPQIKLVYTRTTDVLPGGGTDVKAALRYRAQLANQSKGDLFISIHCNAAGVKAGGWTARRIVSYQTKTVYVGKGAKKRKKTVKQPVYESYYVKNTRHGTETYIWAADRVGLKGESINQAQEEGGESIEDSSNVLDLNSPEARIRAQLYEKKYFSKSLQLATFIEDEFAAEGRASAGVKQRNEKGIWVLQATGMPSVLVETGFITNTEEEQYLNSEEGQEAIVRNILDGLKKYKALLEESRNTDSSSEKKAF